MDPPVDAWHESLTEHKLRRAELIAHVAIGLVSEHGMAGLSMSSIAKAAGISRQTLYKYYPDVESVLTAAIRASSRAATEDIATIQKHETASDQLGAFVDYVLSAAAAGHPSPTVLGTSLSPGAREEIHEHAEQFQALVAAILRKGVEDGTFRADLEPEPDGQIVYRLVLGVHDLAAETADLESVIERVTDAALRLVYA